MLHLSFLYINLSALKFPLSLKSKIIIQLLWRKKLGHSNKSYKNYPVWNEQVFAVLILSDVRRMILEIISNANYEKTSISLFSHMRSKRISWFIGASLKSSDYYWPEPEPIALRAKGQASTLAELE